MHCKALTIGRLLNCSSGHGHKICRLYELSEEKAEKKYIYLLDLKKRVELYPRCGRGGRGGLIGEKFSWWLDTKK